MSPDARLLMLSKIGPPLNPSPVVARPRLFHELDDAVGGSVCTVVAPAGWGKTVLLGSWVERRAADRPIGWLSVGPEENDAAPFWNYLLAALRAAVDEDTCPPLFSLSAPRGRGADGRVFVALLVNALSTLPVPVVLVLDDVHELHAPDVLDQLGFLLRHAPAQLRVVLAGRFGPQAALAEVRGTGRFREIGAAALAFTAEEAGELLAGAGLDLDADRISTLNERAEGWAAGLRMAALSARAAPDPDEQVAGFGPDAPFVADYLLSEVLLRQPPVVQDFLRRISVCRTVDAALAAHLTGADDAGRLLADLHRRNLFITAVTPDRAWFRLHPIFAGFLRGRLERSDPGEARRLHQAAGDWLGRHGHHRDAFWHAADAGDWARAAHWFDRLWLPLYLGGDHSALAGMVARFPDDDGPGGTDRRAVRALLHLATGDLANAVRGLPAETSGPSVPLELVRLHRARLAGDVRAARDAAAALLAAPDPPVELQALVFLHLGAAELWAENRPAARRRLEEALALARGSGRQYIMLGCLSQLAAVAGGQNRPAEAANIARTGLDLAERRGWTHTAEAAMAWHVLGWSHYLWGDLDAADQYLDRAEDAARRGGAAEQATIRCDQALVQAARGDVGGALAALQEARDIPAGARSPATFATLIGSELIRLRCASGQPDAAARLLAEVAAPDPWPLPLLLAKAELRLAQGDPLGALDTLRPALSGAADGFLEERIQAFLLAALASARLGRSATAGTLLAQAVRLGRRERFVQPFIRVPVAALLAAHREPDTDLDEYLETVRAATRTGAEPVAARSGPRPELSAREVEVLRLLPGVLTVPEIAAELYISVNTVKAHLKSIYRKLGAPNRRTAVRAAQSMGLL
ncbi:LuxR C-terminal-related transcriptional regulator [Spongiactinospora sp. 9N601]|uniref:LuxR C-terminal-related transcriptional regulator n=1 Tax=Spongiactinospora sp. 9N601 TaxID=3375149 RepID=UPI00379969B9